MCVFIRVCVSFLEWSWGQIWCAICSNFPFLGSCRKANTFFFFLCLILSLSLFHNMSFYQSTEFLGMGGPQPKVSSIDTHTHTHPYMFDCVRYFTSVCVLHKLVTRGHQQCVSRAGLGWGQHVWVDSQSSVYNQMWTEEHCQAQLNSSQLSSQCACVQLSKWQGKLNYSHLLHLESYFNIFGLCSSRVMIGTIIIHNLLRD